MLWLLPHLCLAQSIAIGDWQIHLPYNNSKEVVEAGNRIYCATGSAVHYLDRTDNSVTRMSKVSGLSDVSVSTIGYETTDNVLVVAYSNANIDLVRGGAVVNIPDIKRKNIPGDKSINSIAIYNGFAYLAAGFGVVVLDISKNEIKDTYYVTVDQDAINQVVIQNDTIYAAADIGLFKAPFTGSNLTDFSSWSLETGLPATIYNSITSLNGKLFLVQSNNPGDSTLNDSIFVRSSNGIWTNFDGGLNEDIFRIDASYNRITVAANGSAYVYTDSGVKTASYTNAIDPRHAILDKDGNIWLADYYAGLIKNNASWGSFPNGPRTDRVFDMAFGEEDLWVAPGGRTGSWSGSGLNDGLFSYINNNWVATDYSTLNLAKDFIRIVVDPNDKERVYAGSWGHGIVELYQGKMVNIYNEETTDSVLQSVVPGDNFIRIGGLAFDNDGNLWVSSTEVDHVISVRKANGEWYFFEFQGIGLNSRVSEVIVDQQGYKWVLLDKAGILVFDDNGTIENKTDDQEIRLGNSVGAGNVSLDVISIAEDLDGEIWVGTNEGIYVFYSPSLVFSNDDFDAQQILVEQDGYFQFLLETEAVTAIAIDGANRKWLGTGDAGVFLMSEDGTIELEHFTVDNSPLLSNSITNIAINQKNGEVFFGTDKGIVSYKGTATEGALTHKNVYAYPNPVREGYTGSIAIKGLVTDADVKITDITGALIYETTALGGQAIWDGKNFSGVKANTGIYLVFASNDEGTETIVTKIMFIN